MIDREALRKIHHPTTWTNQETWAGFFGDRTVVCAECSSSINDDSIGVDYPCDVIKLLDEDKDSYEYIVDDLKNRVERAIEWIQTSGLDPEFKGQHTNSSPGVKQIAEKMLSILRPSKKE